MVDESYMAPLVILEIIQVILISRREHTLNLISAEVWAHIDYATFGQLGSH